MSRRHRHFNPKDAGATAAFDARYGIAVANDAGVDTWTNRVGSNNATQTNGPKQPTFKNTGGNNNSPALLFDGAADALTHSIAALGAPSLFMAVAQRTGGASFAPVAAFMPPNTSNYSIIYSNGYGTGANWGLVPTNSGQSILNAWRILSAKPASTATSNSSTTIWTDGANETTATGNRYAGDAGDRRAIGSSTGATDFFQGSISQVIAIPADVGNPLRKRLEHSAAYSFKIACN
jgi:hypothetical protein